MTMTPLTSNTLAQRSIILHEAHGSLGSQGHSDLLLEAAVSESESVRICQESKLTYHHSHQDPLTAVRMRRVERALYGISESISELKYHVVQKPTHTGISHWPQQQSTTSDLQCSATTCNPELSSLSTPSPDSDLEVARNNEAILLRRSSDYQYQSALLASRTIQTVPLLASAVSLGEYPGQLVVVCQTKLRVPQFRRTHCRRQTLEAPAMSQLMAKNSRSTLPRFLIHRKASGTQEINSTVSSLTGIAPITSKLKVLAFRSNTGR